MNHLLQNSARYITRIVDFFYPPFKRWIPLQMFRYAACGGGNMLLDWILYFLVYNFVLQHRMWDLGFVTMSSHIATLAIVFPITFLTGFYLAKYVSFSASLLQSKTQLFRYALVAAINLLINYLGLKFLVEICCIYPTPSKIIITFISVIFSFLSQKYFSFK
ncbi:MAG: GtrA family protein [Bacteroidales bacterium]|nr:GtrA family protein [Bacteroidales bacterium]